MPITPEQMGKGTTEDSQQIAVMIWAQQHVERWPCLEWLHHIPNGGARGETKAFARQAGGQMKALGTKAGVPDLHLPFPCGQYAGLYIEMKKPNGGDTTDRQEAFLAYAVANHYACAVCHTWQDAVEVLQMYLGGTFGLKGENPVRVHFRS